MKFKLTKQLDHAIFVKVVATDADGNEKQFEVVARFDSEVEIDYYRHGGILQMVLREKIEESKVSN